MRPFKIILLFTSLSLLTLSCGRKKQNYDASGSFEAEEIIIPAEQSGKIMQLDLSEGQELNAGVKIGYIDSTQLFLRKKQLQAQINAVLSRKPDVSVQIAALAEQLKTAESEQQRVSNLVKAEAATKKQLDDINGQIEVIKKQIAAQKSALGISSEGINLEVVPLQLQIEQLNDQLAKCNIINPLKGTVLSKYSEAYEMAITGKPLYKIADLSEIILRVYVTGNQLPAIKLNQNVKVLSDSGKEEYKQSEGTITWISDKAEFTPKTIQTKDERANLVYAVKIKVKNDGSYKIGMYGEIIFEKE